MESNCEMSDTFICVDTSFRMRIDRNQGQASRYFLQYFKQLDIGMYSLGLGS